MKLSACVLTVAKGGDKKYLRSNSPCVDEEGESERTPKSLAWLTADDY